MAPGDKTRKSTRESWLIEGRAGAAEAPAPPGAPPSEWLAGPRRGKRSTAKRRPRQAVATDTGAAMRKGSGGSEDEPRLAAKLSQAEAKIDHQERQIEELHTRLAKLEARVTRMRAKRASGTSAKPRPR
jgi:hypothetical protein